MAARFTTSLGISAAACLLAACTGARTEVIVVTDTDLRGPGGLDRITAVVTAPDGTTQTSDATLGAGQPALPRSLGLVWEEGELGPFTVRVSGETGGRVRVERTARFTFQRGRTLVLRLNLLARCEPTICGTDMTCGETGCRSIDVRPSELVDYTGEIPGLDGSVPGDDGGRGDGGDAGSITCDADSDCDALDGPCTTGTCAATGLCASMPRASGTACDDGLFCTDADECSDGVCTGAARDCAAGSGACSVGTCDEAGDTCMVVPSAEGSACDDGLFCTDMDQCTSGACAGVTRDCADASSCTDDACDETADACVHDATAREGMTCDDGLFCSTGETCTAGACAGGAARACADALFCNGTEMCDETADACASSGDPCADAFTCTVEACAEAGSTCTSMRSEAACAGAQICNPIAYATGATGCGAVPTSLVVACPASGTRGVDVPCTVTLSAGATGVPGEASRITCTARAAPVQLFADDFTGGLDAAWTTTAGSPMTNSVLGNEAAVAAASWQADATVAVSGLATTCVDFRVAQAGAGAGERIRWDVSFGAGAFATVFDLDFATWEVGTQTYAFNRNVCATVPAGNTTARWRLRMDSNAPAIWVDDVVVTGIAAPFTIPTNGGPDDFTAATGWTFAGGSAPYVAAGVMFAEGESYTATRAAIDATACDVLDVDFDFGYQPGAGSLDSGDAVRLEVAVGAGAFTTVELVDLDDGVWNENTELLPWLGLRRITDIVPAAAGASSVVLRFAMSADNPGERTLVDNFVARCADLVAPTITGLTAGAGGSYTFSVLAASAIEADVTCTWSTTNDGPLTGTDSIQIAP